VGWRDAWRRDAALLILGAALGGPACSSSTGPTPAATADDRVATRAAFQQALSRWTSLRISSYEYAFKRTCFCAPPYTDPVRIRVAGGQVVEVVSSRTGQRLPPQDYPGIDGLFGMLRAALDANAYAVRASYDPGLGYPTSFYIDQDTRIADEELAVEAGELRPGN
jgi:Family of unknown function (DUF6174)